MLFFDEHAFLEQYKTLLSIDSTTGQYEDMHNYLTGFCENLGIEVIFCRKGGLIAVLGGNENPLAVTAHFDDIGLMVRHINADGTLKVCPVGGLLAFYAVMENVRVYTRGGNVYTGTVCRTPNSVHVTEEELRKNVPDYRKDVCVVLDMPVHSAEDVRALGIETGDIIALEPRLQLSGGYIKSRFVDDKACLALLLCFMKTVKEQSLRLRRKLYIYMSAYEEISHGTAWLPGDVEDMLAVDIAPTGPDQNSDEQKVSIFAQDSRFPYHWGMTNELRELALDEGIDFVMDIFTPHYGTDCDVSIAAGYDIRHAAIGPGTANSHGYERTHMDGLRATWQLMTAYMMK